MAAPVQERRASLGALQALLPRPWLRTGVDVLLDTIPACLQGAEDGIRFRTDGGIEVGAAFRQLHHAWRAGVVATVCVPVLP